MKNLFYRILVLHYALIIILYLTLVLHNALITRTTRRPSFWGYPLPPHDYPCHWVILDPKSKEDKVKVTNLKNSNFWILKRALHATHLLKLLDKMCKYEMDPMSIVENTERTRFYGQTDRRTDGQTDGQGDTSIPPFQLRWSRGYNNLLFYTGITLCFFYAHTHVDLCNISLRASE